MVATQRVSHCHAVAPNVLSTIGLNRTFVRFRKYRTDAFADHPAMPAIRALATTSAMAPNNAITSSDVVVRPSVKRIAPRASCSDTPMANSTSLARLTPLEQADPWNTRSRGNRAT